MPWIFGLEVAAFSVLVGAILTACFARLQRRWLRWVGPIVFGWLPLAIGAVIIAAILNVWSPSEWRELEYRYVRASTLMIMLAVAAVGLPAAIALIPLVGFRRKSGQSAPRAATWRLWIPVAGVAALTAAFIVTVLVADYRIQRRIRLAQEDLDAVVRRSLPTVADDQNAASLLIDAGNIAGPADELPEWIDNPDPSEYADLPGGIFRLEFDAGAPEVRDFLREKEKSIAIALEAADRPKCWFGGVPEFHSVSMPEGASEQLWRIRNAGKILALSARQRALAGDSEGCWRRLAALRRVGRLLAEDPAMIRRLVGRGFERYRSRTLEAILANRPALALEFPLPIRADDYSYRVGEGLMLDAYRADVLRLYSGLYSGAAIDDRNSQVVDEETRAKFQQARWLSERWLTLLRVFRWGHEADSFLSLTGKLQQSLNEPAPWHGAEFFLVGRYGLPCLDLQATLTAMSMLSRTADMTRLADVGLAAAAFRARYGRYPAKLEALVPEFIDRLPVDPEYGNPMRVQVPSGGGLAIFFSGDDPKYELDEFADMFCLGAACELWRTPEGAARRAKLLENHRTPVTPPLPPP